MKSEESSLKNNDESLAPQKGKSLVKGSRSHFRKAVKIGTIVVSVAVIVTLYVFAHRSSPMAVDRASSVSLSPGKVLQVEVLDGVGSMKIAQRMTDIVRSRGYDVVEMKKNAEGIAEKTIILDRSGNLDLAKKLAQELGVTENKVFQKIDKNLFLDMTIILGKDYATLKPFQSSRERSLP
jgi:hypothetical protein